jgi:hypothetical protein
VADAAFAQGGLMFAKPGEDGGLVHGSFISHVMGTRSGCL